jgi:hypothetical protein
MEVTTMSLTIVTHDQERVTVSGPDDEGGLRGRIGLALFPLRMVYYLRPGEALSIWRALGRQIESARDRRKRARK